MSLGGRMIFRHFVILFFLTNCFYKRESILYSAYHPFVATQLCPLKISGELSSVQSISILLNHANVYDLEEQAVKELGILIDQDAEYMLPLKIDSQIGFYHKIPCRNQSIRIRYLLDGIERSMIINFDKNKVNNFFLRKSNLGDIHVEG